MKKKSKVAQLYKESDIGTIINERMLELQTLDGENFKSLQTHHNVVTVKVRNQTFVISITDKDKLS